MGNKYLILYLGIVVNGRSNLVGVFSNAAALFGEPVGTPEMNGRAGGLNRQELCCQCRKGTRGI